MSKSNRRTHTELVLMLTVHQNDPTALMLKFIHKTLLTYKHHIMYCMSY